MGTKSPCCDGAKLICAFDFQNGFPGRDCDEAAPSQAEGAAFILRFLQSHGFQRPCPLVAGHVLWLPKACLGHGKQILLKTAGFAILYQLTLYQLTASADSSVGLLLTRRMG